MSGIIGQNVGRSSGLKKAIAAAGNTPYFLAHRGADGCSGDGCTQSTSDNTFTKAQFNGERLDTDEQGNIIYSDMILLPTIEEAKAEIDDLYDDYKSNFMNDHAKKLKMFFDISLTDED